MNWRKIILFIIFYIIPLIFLGFGLYINNIVLDLIGFIWIISAFLMKLMAEPN